MTDLPEHYRIGRMLQDIAKRQLGIDMKQLDPRIHVTDHYSVAIATADLEGYVRMHLKSELRDEIVLDGRRPGRADFQYYGAVSVKTGKPIELVSYVSNEKILLLSWGISENAGKITVDYSKMANALDALAGEKGNDPATDDFDPEDPRPQPLHAQRNFSEAGLDKLQEVLEEFFK
ncbi:MAG: hypothetical protein V1743_03700 [Nanoarchaeota archaeon]